MVSILKQKENNTNQAFWVAFGSLISFLASIITIAFLSRYLNKSEYGTYRQILYIYSSLLVVFSVGLPNVYSYFLPRFSIHQGKEIVHKISRLLFIVGIFFSLFLYFGAEILSRILNNDELANGLKFFSPVPIFLFPTLGLKDIFATYKKTIYVAIFNTISRVFMLFCIVLPVVIFNNSYLFAIYGWVLVSIISFILAFFFLKIPFKNVKPQKVELGTNEILKFSFPIVIASIAGISIKAADQFYISRFFGVEVFAEYSNGFLELPFVLMLTGATSTVLMPVFSKIWKDKEDLTSLTNIWKNAIDKSAMLLYPILMFCIAYASEIIELLFSSKYTSSSIYFQINLFMNFFNIVIFAPLFFSMGKSKTYAIVHVLFAVVFWVSSYFVIILFQSPVAVALNNTGLQIIKTLFLVYLATRILKIRYVDFLPMKSILKYLIHGALVISLVKYISIFLPNFNFLIIEILLISILYSMILFASSPIFRINYIKIFSPLLNKPIK